jgi:hypothetical protein
MKIQVILRTDGQPDAEAGETEADDWEEMTVNLPALLRGIADQFEQSAAEDRDEPAT